MGRLLWCWKFFSTEEEVVPSWSDRFELEAYDDMDDLCVLVAAAAGSWTAVAEGVFDAAHPAPNPPPPPSGGESSSWGEQMKEVTRGALGLSVTRFLMTGL